MCTVPFRNRVGGRARRRVTVYVLFLVSVRVLVRVFVRVRVLFCYIRFLSFVFSFGSKAFVATSSLKLEISWIRPGFIGPSHN